MVTFTKAATAELEERVRLFMRNALRLARIGVFGEDPLSLLVKGFCDTEEKRNATISLLSQAQLDLDRLNV
jgi:ATP-dependent exoDNAse (exonuclease V) beta subunit